MQHRKDTFLDAAAEAEVEHVHLALLADAVHASHALLDRHRVPREVVVDHGAAELEVAALAADLARQQDLGVSLERGDGAVLLGGGQAAVQDGHVEPRRTKCLAELVLGGVETGEDDLLLARAPSQIDERLRLGRHRHTFERPDDLAETIGHVSFDRVAEARPQGRLGCSPPASAASSGATARRQSRPQFFAARRVVERMPPAVARFFTLCASSTITRS